MSDSHSFHIEEANDDGQLGSLQAEWDHLISRSSNASIFQTWEWISACRHWFGRGKRLCLLCIREDDRLIGLAPMELASMYSLPLRRLQFIGTGVSDYLDFIIDDSHTEQVLQCIHTWLHEHWLRWDLVDLQNIPEPSPSCCPNHASRITHHETVSVESVEGEICPYLPLADTWDEMLSRFGKKMRFNIGYHERQMRKNFDFEIGTLDAQQLDEGMTAFFRLHAARWRKRFLPGMLTGVQRQGFHRDVSALCQKRGWLHLHGLRLDGELRAVLYCFAFNGRGYYYLGGFEPELAKYSPGTVLTGYAIRRAIESGCWEFDFLRGNEPYKSRWTSDYRTNTRLVISREGLLPDLATSICRLEQQIEHRVKHELHKRIGAG